MKLLYNIVIAICLFRGAVSYALIDVSHVDIDKLSNVLDKCEKSEIDYSNYFLNPICNDIQKNISEGIKVTSSNLNYTFVKYIPSSVCEKMGYIIWDCTSNKKSINEFGNKLGVKINISSIESKVAKEKKEEMASLTKAAKEELRETQKREKEEKKAQAKKDACEKGNDNACWDLYVANEGSYYLDKACAFGHAKACVVVKNKREQDSHDEQRRMNLEAQEVQRAQQEEQARQRRSEQLNNSYNEYSKSMEKLRDENNKIYQKGTIKNKRKCASEVNYLGKLETHCEDE